MKTWVSPVFKRKDGKKECLLSMDDQHYRMEKYYRLIKESGLKIHALVQVITSLQIHMPLAEGAHREMCLGAGNDLKVRTVNRCCVSCIQGWRLIVIAREVKLTDRKRGKTHSGISVSKSILS